MDEEPNCSNLSTLRSSSPVKKKHEPSKPDSVKLQPLSLQHFGKVLKKYEKNFLHDEGETTRYSMQINQIFMKRLHEIEAKASSNLELKVITYQEWVENLLHINESLLSCMVQLESDVCQRLLAVENQNEITERQTEVMKVINENHSPMAQELLKARNDIQRLLSLVRSAYYWNKWDLDDFHFETINASDILNHDEFKSLERSAGGSQPRLEHPPLRFNPIAKSDKIHVKALAWEVAEKHDEILELKQQICSLEEEIQNAQKKIQLKDDVIRELRADLKLNSCKCNTALAGNTNTNNNNNNNMSSDTTDSTNSSPSSHDTILEYTNALLSPTSSCANNLDNSDRKFPLIEKELAALFTAAKKDDLERHHVKLSEYFQKSEEEKAEAYRRLDNLCSQLAEIEREVASGDFDSARSLSSTNSIIEEQNGKIVDILRQRFAHLMEHNVQLNIEVNKQKMMNSDNHSKYITEHEFNKFNSKMLHQIAKLLIELTGKPLNYANIIQANEEKNPFCESIKSLVENFQNRERNLLHDLERTKTEMMQTHFTFNLKREKEINELRSQPCNNEPTAESPSTVVTPTHNEQTTPLNAAGPQKLQPKVTSL